MRVDSIEFPEAGEAQWQAEPMALPTGGEMQPLSSHILIRLYAPSDSKGLYLPDGAKTDQAMHLARVEAVGPGRDLEAGGHETMGVKRGDTILISAGEPLFWLHHSPVGKEHGLLALMKVTGGMMTVPEPDGLDWASESDIKKLGGTGYGV